MTYYCLTFYNQSGRLACKPRVYSTYELALEALNRFQAQYPHGHTVEKINLDPEN